MVTGNAMGSPRASEAKLAHEHAGATSDFVHYVVHFAATREGRTCEMCRKAGVLEHTHYFEAARGEA
jgi:hypothetical protein